ncbi:MAG TPA: O-antigen ligase family protein [Gaiella sp.]|nr:O-antigen ligase family protein [Gaiella sp.]
MDAAPRSALPNWRSAEIVLLLSVGVLLAAAVFHGGGSRVDSLATVGIAALVVAGVALCVGLRGALPLPRLDRAASAAVLGATCLTAWAGVSIAWSIAGDRSWDWLGRGLVYLAFIALGSLVGALAGGARRLAALLALVVGAAIGWALLGVAIPSLFPDGDRIARLREPVGYWNALALLADAAVALGLWLASDRRAVVRVAGALLMYGGALAMLLTQSRAGVVGALAVVALWLVTSRDRLADALRVVVFVGPALVVGGWAFTRPALVEDGVLRADRISDGRVFAAVTLALAIAVALAGWLLPVARLSSERDRAVRTVLVSACAVALVAGTVGLVAKVGDPFSWASSQFSGGECANVPGRLADLCANNRVAWWKESLHIARDRPVGGSGAGTFSIARLRYRTDATQTSEPHSVPFQVLADLGVVGLALLVVTVVGGVVGVRRGLRLARPGEQRAAAALACLVLAFGIHALVDYDLDFLAVSAPALIALGALLAVGRPQLRVRARGAELVAVGAVTVAAVLAVAFPAVADDEVDRSLDATDAGQLADAVRHANRARMLNPLSLAPLEARAYAADVAGDQDAAVAWYERATRLQPENPDPWYDLGLYHVIATHDLCAAYQALNHSYTLDPRSTRWSPRGPLDQARDAVNRGACA